MRALVVVCRFLGDTLLATPLARALRAAGHRVDWLVAPGSEAMIAGQVFAEHIHVLHPSLSGLSRLVGRHRKRYDIACVINGADRPMAAALLMARRVHALVPSRWQDAWKRWLSTSSIHNRPHAHMVEYALELAHLAGAGGYHGIGLRWTDADEAAVRRAIGPAGEAPFVHVHPFARWPYKLWPEAAWRELLHRIHRQGLRIVITAAPAEEDQARRLCANLPREAAIVLAGKLTWPQLACLSHRARCYIGLDTANTHLAASTGAPTLALFGPTNPEIWGPWPADHDQPRTPYAARSESGLQRAGNVRLLQGVQPCVPCHGEGCERKPSSRSDCLDGIAPDRVMAQIEDMLGARP